MPAFTRTPPERFADLPGWTYASVYIEWEGLRLARVDEGGGHPVVMVHGEPTWGYLYRKVVSAVTAAGHRAIAVDLPGFGRSDKPTDRAWYRYDRLVASFDAQMQAVDEPCTLVVHDWGGPVGLRWAVEHPDRVARLMILDTGLYAPGGTPTQPWLRFRDFVAASETLPIGSLVQGATVTELPDDVVAAYDAPFHEPAAHAGALALPLLVPTEDDDEAAGPMWRANQALNSWQRPTAILWGADDAILPERIGRRWADQIPGVVGMDTVPGGHFLQEDAGEEIGERLVAFVATT